MQSKLHRLFDCPLYIGLVLKKSHNYSTGTCMGSDHTAQCCIAHFHWDGSLGAWSCLCDIIAQMFDKVNLTPVPKWVWERNCKIFSRYIGNSSNQWASLLSTYKDAFKNTICSTWAKFFKFPLLLYKEACKNAFSITFTICLQKIHNKIQETSWQNAKKVINLYRDLALSFFEC